MSDAKIIIGAEDRSSPVFKRVRAEILGAGKAADDLNSRLGLLSPALAGAFSVVGIAAFIRGTVNGIDKLNDLSDATGASVENLSALEDIAARTGTSIDTVGDSVIKLNKVLSEATPGSEAASALQLIGLQAKELKGLDPAEAVLKVAIALSKFSDDGDKARLVQVLFAKSIREVAPFLKDMADSGKLVATVTEQQTKAAEAFNQQLSALSKNTLDLARDLIGPGVTSINAMAEAFRAGSKEGKGFFETLRNEQLKILGFDKWGGDEVKALRSELAGIDALLGNGVMLDQRRTALQAKRVQLAQNLASIEAKTRANDPGAGLGFINPALVDSRQSVGPLPDKAKVATAQSEADRYLETLRKQLIGAQELSAAETVLAEIRGGSLRAATKPEQDRAIQLGKEIDATKEAIRVGQERIAREIAGDKDLAALAQANTDRLKGLLEVTPDAQLKAFLHDVEFLNRAFDEDRIEGGAEQWADAIRNGVSKLGKGTKEELDEMSEFARQAAHNIQDALGDTILDSLTGKFGDIGDRWKSLLLKMAAEAASVKLGNYLLGKDFGKTGEFGGVIGDVIKGIGFAGFFANGGTLGAGNWGIAGEAGPEIVKGPAQIVPAGRMGGGGGLSYQDHSTTYIDSRTDQAQVAQLADQISRRNIQAFAEQLRAAGRL